MEGHSLAFKTCKLNKQINKGNKQLNEFTARNQKYCAVKNL